MVENSDHRQGLSDQILCNMPIPLVECPQFPLNWLEIWEL